MLTNKGLPFIYFAVASIFLYQKFSIKNKSLCILITREDFYLLTKF